jgi:hypothetical protein
MRALAGIEVKHNRRYGADCVQRLDPIEIAAEIAAPHQNEGPQLAAGLRAWTTADRSGARGNNDVPGSQWLTRSNEPQDPETVPLRRGSAPIPRTARLSAGTTVRSRLPCGAPQNGAVLTGPLSPQENSPNKGEWELVVAPLPSQASWASRWSATRHPASIALQIHFAILVDTDRPSHRRV